MGFVQRVDGTLIRAIMKNRTIVPLDPLPSEWRDGTELTVHEVWTPMEPAEIEEWAREMEQAAAATSPEDHEQLLRVLDEVERESKLVFRPGKIE